MNKNELISVVADTNEITKGEAGDLIDSVFGTILDYLCEGEDVQIAGFGKFSAVQRKERKGRNPSTGASIVIPAKIVPKMTFAKALKDAVAEGV